MTLNEAIEHCKEREDCTECGQEHKQLRLWLEELQSFREQQKLINQNGLTPENIIKALKNLNTNNQIQI